MSRFKVEIRDLKGNPVRLFKDAAGTQPHEGHGILFTEENGQLPECYVETASQQRTGDSNG